MIKTERGTTTMNGSLGEIVMDYLVILATFKKRVLAGAFDYIEDVEQMQAVLQEAANVYRGVISEPALSAEDVNRVKDLIREVCEEFREVYADN
nr:MAG TPA: hypothetical protein [Caudoviricetes sp.]